MVASSQSSQSKATPEIARWDDVRLFLGLYRERTLTGAGARLGLDASTLSRRLVAMEGALGARLFDRTREGLLPTQAAELLVAPAEEMEGAQLRFSRQASSLEVAVEGVVRLSVPPGVADVFVAPALVRLRARHPKLRIELDGSIRVLDLTRREADLAIRIIRPESGDLVMTKLLSSRWVAMSSPDYVRELGRVRRFDDVRWIGWASDLAGIGPARWLSKHVAADPVLVTSHFAAQISSAEAGLGAALIPESYARVRPLAEVRFADVLAPAVAEWPVDDTWLVGHRALRDVPRIAAVWQFLLEEFGAFNERRRAQRAPSASPGTSRGDRRRSRTPA